MSFQEYGGPNRGRVNEMSPLHNTGAPANSDQNDEYNKLCEAIRQSIFSVSSNIATLQRQISNYGTARDTHEMREKINGMINNTQDLIKASTDNLRQLNSPDSLLNRAAGDNRMKKLEQQKLTRDFQVVLDRFQQIQRLSAEKSREYVARARAQSHRLEAEGEDGDDGDVPLMQQEKLRQQQMVKLDNEIEFNETIIMEREESIKQIEHAIVEVNEIFRDLGSLVNEQQGMIDNIESNIESAASRTGDANVELQSANRYQKKAQSRMCWLLAIAAAVLAVVVIIVIISKSR